MSAANEIKTAKEVADLLRVSQRMVQLMAADGSLPAFRVGRKWRFRREDVEAFICADSTNPDSYDELLGSGMDEQETVELVFTDPPYNVPNEGHVSGLGRHTHREFAMASGEMPAPEFQAFLASIFTQCARVSKDGSVHYILHGLEAYA